MREGRALRGHLPNPVTSPHEPGPLALRRGVASGKRGVSPVSAPGLVGPPFTTGGCGWGEAWPEGTERRVGPVGAEGSAGLPPSWGTWKTGCLAVLSSGGRCGARTPLLPRRLHGRLAEPPWASGLGARSSLAGTAAELRVASCWCSRTGRSTIVSP